MIAAVVLVAGSPATWAQSCPTNPSYLPDFTSNQACLTLNGNASFPTPTGTAATITSWSGASGVVTFRASNSFAAGEVIILSGFANSTFFNGLAFPVLKTGLSKSQFEITFSGFTGSSDTGTATPLKVLQITPNKLNQAGSAWYNTQQPVNAGFSTTFTFQLSNPSTFTADGIAFVIQNSTKVNSSGDPTALGPDGCGIGFGDSASGCTSFTGGIPNSLAVEFNTYLNPGVDKSGNSVSIQSNGTNPNCVDSTCVLPGGLNYKLPITLADGNIHTVQVSYSLQSTPTETSCLVQGNPGPCLDVIVDGNDLFPAGVAANLSTLLNLNNLDYAWLGFTGGTGTGDDTQDILSWTFTTQGQSQSGTLTTTAPTTYNYNGGFVDAPTGGSDFTGLLTSGTSTTAVVTQIPLASQSACNALVQANPLFSGAQCFVYENGGGPGVDAPVMYEVTCPGSAAGGTCGSNSLPDFFATLGTDFDFSFLENSPLSAGSFGLPNLTSTSGLPAVGFLKGAGPDPLHPCTLYPNNNPPLFQSNQILSYAVLIDTASMPVKSGSKGTASCWTVTYDTPGELPTDSIAAPANNAIYQQGSTEYANYSCTAVNSGASSTTGPYLTVASCTATDNPGGSVASGAQFDTSILGTHTFTAYVTDSALNTNASTVTYDVQTSQTITFPSIGNQMYGVPPITLNASASSGLPVSYAVISGPATVNGNMLTITGTGSITVQASQAGNASYAAAASVSQTFTVNPATTTIVWAPPAAIAYGTPLSATQLNATVNPAVAGNFLYTPVAGTVLGAGSQTLSVTFTPGNPNYAPSLGSVHLQVNPVVLIVAAISATGTYGQPLPPLTYAMTGFVNPDTPASATTGSPSEGTAASPSSTPGAYPITITQGTLAAANYTFSFVSGTLTLQQAATTMAVTSLDSSIYPDQSTTLTADVTFAGSGAAPTGNVNFMLGATLLGTASLTPLDPTDSTAILTLNGSQLVPGANSITAVYSGDANYGGSSSSAITVTLLNPQINFGSINVGTAAPVQTVTYYFNSATTLSAVNILTAGAPGLDYQDGGSSTCKAGTAYSAGQSCVVTVAFTPSAPGLRAGAVELFAQNTNLPLMTWYVTGTGLSGAVTIDPGTQSTIGTLGNSGQAYGVAVDGAGNVYVVDNANSLVAKLAAGTFTQTTVVSSGLLNPTSVALDGAGNLYISDTGHSQVVVVPNEQSGLNSADMATVSISGLGSPSGLAADGSGNLYVADTTNGNVIKVPAGGGSATTVVSGLTGSQALALDAGGNLYVAGNGQVNEYPFGGGSPTPVGSGYGTPDGVAVDASGAVYVSDAGKSQIVRVAPGGGSQTTLAIAGLTTPQGIAVDAFDNVYVTDPGVVIQVNRTQAAALSFASTNVDSTSAAQTLTVSDAGNQPLNLSNLAITTNFTQLPSGGANCSSSTQLLSAGQCLIAVAFAPTVSGSLTGTLTLTDNALNNTASSQTVQLSGTGSLVTQTINFPTIPTQTFGVGTITLSATASSNLMPVNFSVTSGPATVSTNMLTITGAGTVTVQASQAGNVEYVPATASQTFQVLQQTPSVSVTSVLPASEAYGSGTPTTVTATLAWTGGGAAPTGGLSFAATAGGSFGTASCPTTSSPIICTATFTPTATDGASTYTISAHYAGDSNYLAATSTNSFTITAATLTVTANPQTMVYGGTVPAFTVSYSGFVNNDGQGSLGGTLICTSTGSSSSAAGPYPITCSGQTSSNYTIAYKSGTLTISSAGTTTSVVSNPSSSAFGQSVTFTASIAPASGSGETGTVTWSGNTGCATSTVTSGNPGTATCTTSLLAAGTDAVTATYSGDPNHTTSTATLSQVVNLASTKTTLGSSANPSLYGTSVSFTATVAAVAPGAGTPTGTVTFMDGATTLGSVALSSGQAMLTTSALSAGANSITASYGGSASFSSSSSATLTQTVNQLPAFTSASSTTFTSGVAGSFSAKATGFPTPTITESGTLPSGLVFTGGTGSATLSGTTTAVGTYTISFIATNAAGTVTQTFTLLVSGPMASVSPTSINFANIKCGSSTTSTVTLANTGTVALSITKVALTLGTNADSDDFAVKNGCSSSLASGKSCTINITYTPDDPGAQSATLVITDNAPGSPQQVSITATNTCKADKD